MNPSCSCILDVKDTLHFLLHCHSFPKHRTDLMKSVNAIFDNFESLSDNLKKDVFLYDDLPLNGIKTATLAYMKNCGRLSGP